jgi:hypothetical protein
MPSLVISRDIALAPIDINLPIIGWHNIVTATNVTADTADASHPASELANPATYLFWKGTSTALQYLTVATGYTEVIDYLGVAKHNFGTAGIAVSVEGFVSGAWKQLVAPSTPTNDGPLLFRYPSQVLPDIRLKMQSGSAIPQAAVLYVGKLLQLERRIYVGHTPIVYGRRSNVVTGMSESGEFIGRLLVGETRETQASLQNITPAFYRASIEPFVAAASTNPFFFSWRPQEYPSEVGFVSLSADVIPSNQRSNGMMQATLQMIGVA